ncbi:MAG: DNA polymerase III subunit delta' [Gammaproteobacteria bacterium]|nr:DNA polymerase III subunit delta' [Gammaproteobacteria bacterium]
MSSIYPWQINGLGRLTQALEQERLPHAVLLLAKYGSGERQFVQHWSQVLLCEKRIESEPCRQCKSCLLFNNNTHPDFIWIETEEGKKQISIQQVRDLSEKLTETSHQAGWRMVVIYQAERLTVNGYNALLKTLEEPGRKTHIVLVAADKSSIPATIISRCQQVSVDVNRRKQALDWLLSSGGENSKELCEAALSINHYVPLKAQHFLEQGGMAQLEEFLKLLIAVAEGKEPLTAIGKMIGNDVGTYWSLWEYIVTALIKQQSLVENSQLLYHKELSKLAGMMNMQLLFKFRDELLYQNKQFLDGVTLNIPMQVDFVADAWVKSRAR